MIRKVHIQNFKSLADFEMELGRVNVIIGANGSGKTNILEGIAMGAAAAAGKLDYEFLGNRIRVSTPEYMKSAFPAKDHDAINLRFEQEGEVVDLNFELFPDETDGRKWTDRRMIEFIRSGSETILTLYNSKDTGNEIPEDLNAVLTKIFAQINELPDQSDLGAIFQGIAFASRFATNSRSTLSPFVIYSQENLPLRKFEEPYQITPLGIHGEGLFHELKRIFTDKKKKKQQAEIVEHLQLLDWFEGISIPNGLMSMEYKIAIKDRFLDPKLAAFDQRSANEGFLMLLFYLVLFTSENTPKFFAIENIDTAFNPKMCREIMRLIAELAVKHEKQVIVTTHNPWTLDGLNLTDDEQRLFVARRNNHGHTKVERISEKADSNLMLSEIWTRGYFGGLPDNF